MSSLSDHLDFEPDLENSSERRLEANRLTAVKTVAELQTFLKYEKQLRNLQLQEARLQRRYEKDSAELRNLQKQRTKREDEALKNQKDNAAQQQRPEMEKKTGTAQAAAPRAASTLKNGFEFSTAAKDKPSSDFSYVSERHANCT